MSKSYYKEAVQCQSTSTNQSHRDHLFNLKDMKMSEPISSTAAGVFGWKALGGIAAISGIGAGLATYVVMAMTKPKSNQEWHVSIVSTLIGSFCGGAALIKYLGIEHWADTMFGLMGLIGIIFMCGLPGWLVVRSLFKYMEKKQDASIDEIIRDVKDSV